MVKQFSGVGRLSATSVLSGPALSEMAKQFSRAESGRVNQVLALSGVFPRVAPTELQSASNGHY
jgi:hypothetical protein